LEHGRTNRRQIVGNGIVVARATESIRTNQNGVLQRGEIQAFSLAESLSATVNFVGIGISGRNLPGQATADTTIPLNEGNAEFPFTAFTAWNELVV
jgi:hypothetical protein